jgi:hypothetical protein
MFLLVGEIQEMIWPAHGVRGVIGRTPSDRFPGEFLMSWCHRSNGFRGRPRLAEICSKYDLGKDGGFVVKSRRPT